MHKTSSQISAVAVDHILGVTQLYYLQIYIHVKFRESHIVSKKQYY